MRGNNDDINVYVNDLSFIKKYCPEDTDLYQNVEGILFAMYENRPVNTGCSNEEGPHLPFTEKSTKQGIGDTEPRPPVAKSAGPKSSQKTGGILDYLKRKGFIKNSGPTWKDRKNPSQSDSERNPRLH